MTRNYGKKNEWVALGDIRALIYPFVEKVEARRAFLSAVETHFPDCLVTLHEAVYPRYDGHNCELLTRNWAKGTGFVDSCGEPHSWIMSAAEYVIRSRARDERRSDEKIFFDHLVISCERNRWARFDSRPAFNVMITDTWEDWVLGGTATLPFECEQAFLRPDLTLLLLGRSPEKKHVIDRGFLDSVQDLSATFELNHFHYDPTRESRPEARARIRQLLDPQIEQELESIERITSCLSGASKSHRLLQESFQLLALAFKEPPKSGEDWEAHARQLRIKISLEAIYKRIREVLSAMGLRSSDLPHRLVLPNQR